MDLDKLYTYLWYLKKLKGQFKSKQSEKSIKIHEKIQNNIKIGGSNFL